MASGRRFAADVECGADGPCRMSEPPSDSELTGRCEQCGKECSTSWYENYNHGPGEATELCDECFSDAVMEE